MGRTADSSAAAARRRIFEVDEDRALEALRLYWGDAYEITFEYSRFAATSRDAEARTFTGETPDALDAAVRADWAREGTL